MKNLFKIIGILSIIMFSNLTGQTPIVIGTITTTGSTGTIIVDEDDLKDAFDNEFNDGTSITSVAIEKGGSNWYLTGSGTKTGGYNVSVAMLLDVINTTNVIISGLASPTLSSCNSYCTSPDCNLNSDVSGCTPCNLNCTFDNRSKKVSGELGGYGFE